MKWGVLPVMLFVGACTAKSSPDVATIGELAPDFVLESVNGGSYRLSEARGSPVVLEWFNPDCPFTRNNHSEGALFDLPEQMSKRYPGLRWFAINSSAPNREGGGRGRNIEAQKTYAMTTPLLLDPSGDVGKRYRAQTTPHMFVIDAGGVLRYSGALDNAPMGESNERKTLNYVENALGQLSRGKPVHPAQVKPYGCSVKYGL
ncbi:MAG: redoxin domain-containing protein [Myxococcota bacterium]